MNTLKFENGNAVIELKDLEKTLKLELATGGLKKSAPVEHFTLLNGLMSMAEHDTEVGTFLSQTEWGNFGTQVSHSSMAIVKNPELSFSVDPIHVNDKYANRIQWTGEKDLCPIENYLIKRLVTKINVHRESELEVNQAIAVSYNENGIALAMGTNVKVCSNMNIFGGNLMSTYGANKMPFERMMDLVKHWMQNLNPYHKADMDVIDKLKAISLDSKMVNELLGQLIRQAALSNFTTKIKSPINVTQVCRMIENGSEILTNNDFSNYTAWDFQNQLTYVLKPNTSDMSILLQNQQQVANFMTDSFSIEYANGITLTGNN